jgi:glycosyltransferase involved in cell wall biosynthesis
MPNQRPISLAVIHDMPEEGWSSMDQMGQLVASRVPMHSGQIRTTVIDHHLVRVASRVPLGRRREALLADRILNRMVLYPRRIRREVTGRYNLYHVVDHSYAQLVLDLPANATVVSCHDIDTFRAVAQPREEPRNLLFRTMTKRILAGLRRAAIVVCGSETARADVVRFGLVDPARLHVVPNGIDPALLETPSEAAHHRAAELLPVQRGVLDVLHVGNDIPRKRLDRVIEIVSGVRSRGHRIRLVRVGSPLRKEARQRAQDLGMFDIVELPYIERDVLRAVYERCDLLLLPSDREGYGLPVLEAFAAGRPVVASDIPALRESSGGLATLVKPDALQDWVLAVEQALGAKDPDSTLAAARRARASARTWDHHVRGLLPVYAELLDRTRAASPGPPPRGLGAVGWRR